MPLFSDQSPEGMGGYTRVKGELDSNCFQKIIIHLLCSIIRLQEIKHYYYRRKHIYSVKSSKGRTLVLEFDQTVIKLYIMQNSILDTCGVSAHFITRYGSSGHEK